MLSRLIKIFATFVAYKEKKASTFLENTFWESWVDKSKYQQQGTISSSSLSYEKNTKELRFYHNLNDQMEKNSVISYDFNLGDYDPDTVRLFNSAATSANDIVKVLVDGRDMGKINEIALEDNTVTHNVILIVNDIKNFDTSLLFYVNTDLHRYITNIQINKGLKAIGEKTFAGLSNITEVTIPSSVTTLGDEAFKGCLSLEKAIMSDNVKTIPTDCFPSTTKIYDTKGNLITV